MHFFTNKWHSWLLQQAQMCIDLTVMNTKGLLRPLIAPDLKAFHAINTGFLKTCSILKPKQDEFSVNICKVALK